MGQTLNLNAIIQRAQQTKHGFAYLRREAEEMVANNSMKESLRIARQLFASDVYQARMIATLIFGMLAAKSAQALRLMREHVSTDESWQVQEILAQAFDRYCADLGYEKALPIITDWLTDANPNMRRAASEGLRIWTTRPYFKEHPALAIRLLSQLKDDSSEYVRKAAGNALRDISRKHKDLIRKELQSWDVSNKAIAQTHQLAGQFVMPKTSGSKRKGI